jgi:hypothetical protein
MNCWVLGFYGDVVINKGVGMRGIVYVWSRGIKCKNGDVEKANLQLR